MKKLAFCLAFLFCGSLLAGDEILTPRFSLMPENDLQNFEMKQALDPLELAYPRQPCCDPKRERGRRGARGPRGLDGADGATGATGATGALGATGSQGATGTSASLASLGAFVTTNQVLDFTISNTVLFDKTLGEYDPNGIITFVPPSDTFVINTPGSYLVQFTGNLGRDSETSYTPDITISAGIANLPIFTVSPTIASAALTNTQTVSAPAILTIVSVPASIEITIFTNSTSNQTLFGGSSILIQKLN